MLATLKQYKSSNDIPIVNQGSMDRIHCDFNPLEKNEKWSFKKSTEAEKLNNEVTFLRTWSL